MSPYAQLLARTVRPTQVLAAVRDLDAYLFPYTATGSLICERTSEEVDLRIVVQVGREVSARLEPEVPVLTVAGDEEGSGFWCALFEGGRRTFEHHRLTGRQDISPPPATRPEVEILCRTLGGAADPEQVDEILDSHPDWSAVEQHAALFETLGLPKWAAGVGYSRAARGDTPAEAGAPARSPRRLAEVRPLPTQPQGDGSSPDPLDLFFRRAERAFAFLVSEFGFAPHRAAVPPRLATFPQIVQGVYMIGPGYLRPGYDNPYLLTYGSRKRRVVLEGLSGGARTRLALLDQQGRLLDLTSLVERSAPELLDLCALAQDQSEQLPMFAEALRACAAWALDGDPAALPPAKEGRSGFTFEALGTRDEADYVLARCGPRGHPRTLWARLHRALRLRKVAAELRAKARSGGMGTQAK